MNRTSLLTAAAAAVLFAGVASAQTTPAPNPNAAQPAQPATPATPATPAAPGETAATPATPATPATAAVPQVQASGDIIATAKAAGQFNTFLKAVEATNLTQVLKTNKGLTVFAPTDAAFAALPPGTLDRLMSPAGRTELQRVLTYHVINATVDSSKMKGAKGPVPTVAGTNVVLDGSGEALMVNDATIVQADIRPTNGTLHVIDKVLLPSGAAAASSTSGTDASASTTAPAATSSAAPSTAPAAASSASAAPSSAPASATRATPASPPASATTDQE